MKQKEKPKKKLLRKEERQLLGERIEIKRKRRPITRNWDGKESQALRHRPCFGDGGGRGGGGYAY